MMLQLWFTARYWKWITASAGSCTRTLTVNTVMMTAILQNLDGQHSRQRTPRPRHRQWSAVLDTSGETHVATDWALSIVSLACCHLKLCHHGWEPCHISITSSNPRWSHSYLKSWRWTLGIIQMDPGDGSRFLLDLLIPDHPTLT